MKTRRLISGSATTTIDLYDILCSILINYVPTATGKENEKYLGR